MENTINEGCKKEKTSSNESNCDYPEELKSLVEDKLVKLWKDNEGITDTEFVDTSSEIMEKGYSFEDIFNCFQDCIESDETELDESSKEKYVKNGFYISEDGKFSFVVTSSSNGSVSIIDVSDEENPKEYKVDVSDLELAKATLVEVIKDFDMVIS